MMKYTVAMLVIFAVLVFLKYCEGTPFRSWKAVLLTGVPLGLPDRLLQQPCVPAKAAPPVPQAQKASAYRAEMERAWRRIAGVDGVQIVGTTVHINLAESKPLPAVKNFAREVAGSASYFLRTNIQPIGVKVRISVSGKKRYEMDYLPGKGVVGEQEFCNPAPPSGRCGPIISRPGNASSAAPHQRASRRRISFAASIIARTGSPARQTDTG